MTNAPNAQRQLLIWCGCQVRQSNGRQPQLAWALDSERPGAYVKPARVGPISFLFLFLFFIFFLPFTLFPCVLGWWRLIGPISIICSAILIAI